MAPVLCAGLTVYKGLKESGARPGEFVAIVGAGGGLGSMAIQYAHAMGLHTVAIDGGAEKEKMCKELGATAYVDFTTSKNIVEDVKKATPDGLGPHAVLLLAVSEKPFQQASGYVRSHGTIVCVGLPANAYLKAPVFDTVIRYDPRPPSPTPSLLSNFPPFSLSSMVLAAQTTRRANESSSMITIKGSYVGNRQDTAEAIDFFRRGLIKAPYKVVGLSQLQDVFELMEAGKIAGRYVVDTSK